VVAFIGLTGGIGAGKSAALEALSRQGAATLSTDAVVHDLYELAEVREAVIARFGSSVSANGEIDRGALARHAFASAEDRAWLEQLLWPRVGERMTAWRVEVERASPTPRAAVVEVPLLFESGFDRAFDATIAILADEGLRNSRAASRGHHAVSERSARQLSQDEKAARATYVVVNDGTLAELDAKLSAVLEMLST
jgi:dephospho-CoA kinase